MLQQIALAEAELTADCMGALYWAAERTLIVADLHLEKGSAYAMRGLMLPPYDTRTTLSALAAAISAYTPRTVIALGDSFHDAAGAGRLLPEDRDALLRLQLSRTWVWISGNHDPEPCADLGGEAADEMTIAGITLRHEPDPDARTPEIAGHLHPAARLNWNGASVRRRCFASDPRRLILPAFGAFTGGLNLMAEPFAALFPQRPSRVDMLGAGGIFTVPPSALVAD